ncbi:TIGR02117 family protein [Chishuiella sp.]|uniref:TIGR02117 family protein n=1 Tax=Chishuiella sp. TaxID=1969467 RepID=UPI0028AFF404|nr:TIGR02117 family protein [Chishuiella sp.]
MRKFILILFRVVVSIISLVIIYLFAIIILPLFGVNNKKGEKLDDSMYIYIVTNGMHTDIIVPVKTDIMDWSKIIPYSDTKSKKHYNNIAFGWGDKGFYLNTPEWSDLKLSTAINAAFGIGSTAMHVTFYNDIYLGENCKQIKISKEDYKQLVNYIKNSFDLDSNNKVRYIKTDALYGENDSFYEAKGTYSIFYTCNTWTANALKHANQKAPLWTATQQGIFYHYR